jgi:hypothetical protein
LCRHGKRDSLGGLSQPLPLAYGGRREASPDGDVRGDDPAALAPMPPEASQFISAPGRPGAAAVPPLSACWRSGRISLSQSSRAASGQPGIAVTTDRYKGLLERDAGGPGRPCVPGPKTAPPSHFRSR